MSWPEAIVWMTGLSCTAAVIGAVALAVVLRERGRPMKSKSTGHDTPETARCWCGHVVADHVQASDPPPPGSNPRRWRARTGCVHCACGGPR